jgi:hypothetical protein
MLVNADCLAEHPNRACLVGKKTTNFGVRTADAKFFRLDPKGNSMAPALISKAQNQTGEMCRRCFWEASRKHRPSGGSADSLMALSTPI